VRQSEKVGKVTFLPHKLLGVKSQNHRDFLITFVGKKSIKLDHFY